ncbi:hypothetical protein K1719_035214 [Acacia pycnantha]|nr:hypothetical protein K1719_035214 [Acacia pycnantha]
MMSTRNDSLSLREDNGKRELLLGHKSASPPLLTSDVSVRQRSPRISVLSKLTCTHNDCAVYVGSVQRSDHGLFRLSRFRSDNLYLLGYVPVDENNNPLKQWLELRNGGQLVHLITERGTQFLSFEGSYGALARAANQSIQDMRFGVYRLQDAIDKLAATTDGMRGARSLVVVIMMISEATRLIPVFDCVAQGFDNNPGTSRVTERRIEPHITESVHHWEFSSEKFLRAGEELGISLGRRSTPIEERIHRPMVNCAKRSKDFSINGVAEMSKGYEGPLFGSLEGQGSCEESAAACQSLLSE